jgi:hypothetical protein
MKHNKKLEQRTFLQDRFEILIKKQKKGNATFSELTELDEIVNANAIIRQKIMREMEEFDGPSNNPIKENQSFAPKKQSLGLLDLIKSFITRLFISKSAYYTRILCFA